MTREPTGAEMIEYAEWLSSRPPAVAEVIRLLPPGTKVRAKEGETLICPAPGVVGQVVSYTENDDHVGVRVSDGVWAAECDPGWLEVVDDERPRALLDRALELAEPS